MRKLSGQATWLRTYHWEELANLHMELGCLRHQFIQAVNANVATRGGRDLEALDQLATIDELLQGAGQRLDHAKRALFDFCYERGAAQADR